MVIELTQTEERIETNPWQPSPLPEIAGAIRDNALNLARTKLPYREKGADLSMLLQRADFMDYFKNAMAQEVAQVMAAFDRRILAVYLFDESANPDAETEDYLAMNDLTIHLLVRVSSTSAALEAFITSLDRALTDALRELPSKSFADRLSFLDVILINNNQAKSDRGYAVLLRSIFAPPVKIWQRD